MDSLNNGLTQEPFISTKYNVINLSDTFNSSNFSLLPKCNDVDNPESREHVWLTQSSTSSIY